jgi:hypothetical protein
MRNDSKGWKCSEDGKRESSRCRRCVEVSENANKMSSPEISKKENKKKSISVMTQKPWITNPTSNHPKVLKLKNLNPV